MEKGTKRHCYCCLAYFYDLNRSTINCPKCSSAYDPAIAELKKNYGDRITFYGGIDCQEILTNGTPDDVRKNVNNAVSILGKNGGFILSPINVMSNVPVDNLKALIDTVNMYR